jgi:hypothetical protein
MITASDNLNCLLSAGRTRSLSNRKSFSASVLRRSCGLNSQLITVLITVLSFLVSQNPERSSMARDEIQPLRETDSELHQVLRVRFYQIAKDFPVKY